MLLVLFSSIGSFVHINVTISKRPKLGFMAFFSKKNNIITRKLTVHQLKTIMFLTVQCIKIN